MLRLKIINNPKPLRLRTQVNFPNVILGKMQEKTVKPKTTFQEILPDKNYDGLSKVNVEAVTNEIDENIKSENIKKDVSILGVQGNVEVLKGTKLEVTKNGTYTPKEPYNAFTEIEVNMDLNEYFGGKIENSSGYKGSLYRNIKKFPVLEISGTSLRQAFYGMKELIECPDIDTSNVTDFDNSWYGCKKLITIPLLNFSNVVFTGSMVGNCASLKNLGGFFNLGASFLSTTAANYNNYKVDLSSCTDLTHDSLMNVGNNLYDIKNKGCNAQQVILGTNKTKLSVEELLVFTNKGFTVS